MYIFLQVLHCHKWFKNSTQFHAIWLAWERCFGLIKMAMNSESHIVVTTPYCLHRLCKQNHLRNDKSRQQRFSELHHASKPRLILSIGKFAYVPTASKPHAFNMNLRYFKNDFKHLCAYVLMLKSTFSNVIYYIPINDTTFELSVFWPSDTESWINEQGFSESVSLSFQTRLTSVTCLCSDVT